MAAEETAPMDVVNDVSKACVKEGWESGWKRQLPTIKETMQSLILSKIMIVNKNANDCIVTRGPTNDLDLNSHESSVTAPVSGVVEFFSVKVSSVSTNVIT